LSRADVEAALSLTPHAADRLSKLLIADCPFLASGDVRVQTWDREIDERIVEYDDVRSVEAFLLRVAEQRQPARMPSLWAAPEYRGPAVEVMERAATIRRGPVGGAVPPAAAGGNASSTPESAKTALPPVLTAASLVLGVGANALAFALAGFAWQVALAAALVAGVIVVWRWPHLGVPMAVFVVVVAGALAGIGAHVLHNDSQSEPKRPVSTQLEAVVKEAVRDRRHVVTRRRLSLHGTGTTSHLLIFRDEDLRDRFRTDLQTPQALSDDVRIYDEVSGELRLRFRFQPQNPGEVLQAPDGDMPSFVFRLGSIADLDENGKVEVFGSFERISLASGPFPVPVIIAWDEGQQRYRLSALIPEPPQLLPPDRLPRAVLDGYLKATEIHNQHTEQVVSAHAADTFVVTKAPRAPVLVASYSQQTRFGYGGRDELKAWFLDLQSPTPRFLECGAATAGGVVVRPDSPGDLNEKMLAAAKDPRGCGAP
jgi:hypothetical protein